MNNQRSTSRAAWVGRAAFALGLFIAFAGPWSIGTVRAQQAEPLVLVVSHKSAVRNLSSAQLRAIFLNNGASIRGRLVKPVNLRLGTKSRSFFDSRILGMSRAASSRYWLDRKVRGKGLAPSARRTALSVQLAAYRASTVIGYVPLSSVRAGKLRIVTIDGKGHNHPDYPLRAKRGNK